MPLGFRTGRWNFDWSLGLGEIAISLWFWYACAAFTTGIVNWWPDALWMALTPAAGSWILGRHRQTTAQALAVELGRSVLHALLVAGLVMIAAELTGSSVFPAFAFWFGTVTALLYLGFHLLFWAARSRWTGQPREILRWLAMGGAGFALLFPYYGRQGLGSGDAYWYVEMAADFIAQIRRGVFPVWIGQSEYAFIGAVSPLRLAPWFQYSAGFWDLLTCHQLEPTALKNAVIAASGLLTAASAYLAVRLALPRRPNLAAALALLWLSSPGVLAPLYAGDQFMEWVSMPFLPPLLLGCWRLWTRNDAIARVLITISLAGMLLSHPPTALWGGLLAAGMYCGQLVQRRNWAAELRWITGMIMLFAVLGTLPLGSALTIDNAAAMTISGRQVPPELARAFPGNFRPINRTDLSLQSYQVGYSLLAVAALSLILLLWLRPRGWATFVIATLAVAPLTLPIPGLTPWIWGHLPGVVVTITNIWPTQRLFQLLGMIIVFALILALGAPHLPPIPRRIAWLPAILALGAILWSGSEAEKMVVGIRGTFVPPEAVAVDLRPENLRLTRYLYAPFKVAPNFASQAHVDPLLENRLLDRHSLAPMADNAETAAPRLSADSDPATVPRLVQSGLWTATSGVRSRIYRLQPQIHLEPGQRYALRLDFLRPTAKGVLQLSNRDIFREYQLPDSGLGLSPVPMAFGSLATSHQVVALEQNSPDSTEPVQQFVAAADLGRQFDFARFWLFRYEPANLPIQVSSWIPYRAETESAVPAFLETPRIWQRGWRATVNGRPVPTAESPQRLVMVPIEAGASEVVLTFRAPAWLTGAFWLSFLGWAALLGWSLLRVVRLASLGPLPPELPTGLSPGSGSGP